MGGGTASWRTPRGLVVEPSPVYSKGELGGWQWGGSTEHLPPPLGEGERDLGAHILGQGTRVSASPHGKSLSEATAEQTGGRAQAPGGIHSKR